MKTRINKVLFIQQLPFANFGVLSLASMLDANGYKTDSIVTSLEKNFSSTLKKVNPDLVCITAMSMEIGWAKATAVLSKRIFPDTPIVLGGVHAMLYPKDAINIKGVDYVCNCEGEITLLKLIEFISNSSKNGKGLGLKGILLKDNNGDIIDNEVESLVEDISQYTENRKIYYLRYPQMIKDKIRFFYSSRGCPYDCAFCFNGQMRKKFENKGRYIRFKDPVKFIEEIEIEKKYGFFNFVFFSDDLFTMNKEWLKEFTKLYKKRVGISYACLTRVEFFNEEILVLLKESGCERLVFGIETGNENLRVKMLNKRIKNDQLIKMAKLIRSYDIKLQTYNMFGLPTETLENSFETIDLNIKMKTDIVSSSLFLPFPDTELSKKAIELGVIDPKYSFDDMPRSFHKKSALQSPVIDKQESLHKIIFFAVRYPYFYPLIKKIVRSNNRVVKHITKPVFFIIFVLSFFYRYKGDNNTFWDAVKFIYKYRTAY